MTMYWRISKQVEDILSRTTVIPRASYFMRKRDNCSRNSFDIGYSVKLYAHSSEVILCSMTNVYEARAVVGTLRLLQQRKVIGNDTTN